MTRFFMVRHGETEWNRMGLYQGQSEVALTGEGRIQARMAGACLAEVPFTAVYSSDLVRALDTAEEIARPHGLPVVPMDSLREINFGEWEGRSFSQIAASDPRTARQWLEDPTRVQVPSGESFPHLQERVWNTVLSLAERHPEQNVCLVAHGAVIRTAVCAAMEVGLECLWRFRQDNGGISVVDVINGRGLVVSVNCTGHLNRGMEAIG